MDVIPFKGYRYDADAVGDPGDCIAPPYDVIDADQQETLYQRHRANIVRLIRGRTTDQDNDTANVYTRAAEHLKDFLDKDELKQDAAESFYVYAQDFTIADVAYRRSGFVGLGKLEAYGGAIKPHEQTLAGPKADRLNLTRATKTQIGQIFMLYSEPEKTIDTVLAKAAAAPELLSHTDEDGVTHRLYAVTDPTDLETIKTAMKDRPVFIADGHHRYETALNYMNESDNLMAAYQMMCFVNTHNEGLTVLPTHRLIRSVADFDKDKLLGDLSGRFEVTRTAYDSDAGKQQAQATMQAELDKQFTSGGASFGIYFNDGAFYTATLKHAADVEAISGDYSPQWRKLDVSILHKLILEEHLGIDEAALTAQTNCDYIKDFGDATARAMGRVDSGEAQALFFMNPTRIEDVEAVALGGEKMPQKSTFFFPKIYSGLVLNVLERPV